MPNPNNPEIVVIEEGPKKPVSSPGEVIGLPPNLHNDPQDKMQPWVVSSMPMCRIRPMVASTADKGSSGLHLFSLIEGKDRYKKVLESLKLKGLTIPEFIDVAYMNETSISETFTNDYGDSKFEELANMGSSVMGEMRQITGKDTGSQALGAGGDLLGQIAVVGGAAEAGFDVAAGGMKVIEDFLKANKMGSLLSGSRVDFPQIWKNSSYSTSYSITTRLYNPMPTNEDAYMKFIVHPLAKLLAFVVPVSDDESITYFTPLLCRVKCAGLWEIRSGYISNIDVIKGGDSNDISFHMRPGMIDVRISFGELYGVMTTSAFDGTTSFKDRPTLGRYINTLTQNSLSDDVKFYNPPEDGNPFYTPATPVNAAKPAPTVPKTDKPKDRVPTWRQKIGKRLKDVKSYTNPVGTLTGIATDSITSCTAWYINRQEGTGPDSVPQVAEGAAAAQKGDDTKTTELAGEVASTAPVTSTTGKIRDEVSPPKASLFSLNTMKVVGTTLVTGGVAVAGALLGTSTEAQGGIASTELTTASTTISASKPTTNKNYGNTLSSLLSQLNKQMVGDGLKEGQIGKGGQQSQSDTKAILDDAVTVKESLNSASKNTFPNTVIADTVDISCKLLTGHKPKKKTNPGSLIGILEAESTGFTYEDLVDGNSGLVNNTIPELNVILFNGAPISFKETINDICFNYCESLDALVGAKTSYDGNPTDTNKMILESFKTQMKYVLNSIPNGYIGDIVTSTSLADICDCINGNISESISNGLITAVGNYYLSLAANLIPVLISLNALYADCVTGGASSGTLADITSLITDTTVLRTQLLSYGNDLKAIGV